LPLEPWKTVYLASPRTQKQAEHAAGMPVLLSFACWSPWLDRYQQTFRRVLIDSGAFSEYTTGKAVDLARYADWAGRWVGHADAIAGLDSILGDWRQSLKNYQAFALGFPTFHDSDVKRHEEVSHFDCLAEPTWRLGNPLAIRTRPVPSTTRPMTPASPGGQATAATRAACSGRTGRTMPMPQLNVRYISSTDAPRARNSSHSVGGVERSSASQSGGRMSLSLVKGRP
jgi:hypothetical protein